MEHLAQQVNPPTTASQINKLEKGRVELTESWMRRLANALECEIFDLLDAGMSESERKVIKRWREMAEKEQQAFETMLGIDDE